VAGETKNGRDFKLSHDPITEDERQCNRRQEEKSREQDFEQTNRSEIDHEAEGLRADDWELHGIDDGDDDDDIYNFQLATG
jgi:hypothetical protein